MAPYVPITHRLHLQGKSGYISTLKVEAVFSPKRWYAHSGVKLLAFDHEDGSSIFSETAVPVPLSPEQPSHDPAVRRDLSDPSPRLRAMFFRKSPSRGSLGLPRVPRIRLTNLYATLLFTFVRFLHFSSSSLSTIPSHLKGTFLA
jgi:hypothetical protein